MSRTVLFLLVLAAILFTVETARSQEPVVPSQPQQPQGIAVPQDPNYVVMVLDGNELTIGKAKFFTPDFDYATLENVADFWLNTQLLYEEAVKRGIDKDPKAKFLADISYKKVIAGELIEKSRSTVKISDEQVKKYYEDNKETDPGFREPNYLSFSHITVETLEQAQEALKRINSGEEINELAKSLSVAGDAKKGGRLTKSTELNIQTHFGQELLDALLKASEGDIVGPVKGKNGKYEIARHEGKRASRIMEFDKVKDRIKAKLEGQAKNKAVEDLIQSLKEKAKQRYKKMGILSEKDNAENVNEKSEKKK
ncbi:MAG: peptidyl-prolyl cis-trans isomerase [Phycisphaerae bacterium]|jgi:hypothetical protein